tara:strand:- start:3577 stop:4560 length:984 start_codon:yes stop_codon:yes gene_type:complete
MRNNISILILSLVILSCSQDSKESVLPEMNAYSEDQNYVLERFQWLGFDPSLVSSQPLKDGLGVIFGYGGNILVSVGEDGVLIVDSQFPEVFDTILGEINKMGGDSVDYVINTHFHFDHAEGNRAFGPLGADIIAHENSIDYFRNGTDINMVGVVWPQQPYELLATPRVTYKDEMSMHLNGHTIKIMHYGPAHTSGDSFIYFEESNVIHLGDVANLTGLPFIDAGNGGTLEGMIFSIREVMKIINEDTLIVPGHGEVSDINDLEEYVSKMETAYERLIVLKEKGLSLEEVMELDPAADIFPSSPFDAGTGYKASQLFADRAYTSMLK